MTRKRTGMTSRRSDTSSPILTRSAEPQAPHAVISGSITTSTRSRWAGSFLRGRGARARGVLAVASSVASIAPRPVWISSKANAC